MSGETLAAGFPQTRRPGSRVGCRQLAKSVLRCVLPRGLFLVRGERSSGSVCLTFDDGPDPCNTPPLLDVLQSAGVKATFFLIGKNIEAHPDVVRRIVAEGHAVGHHTYSHSNPRAQSAAGLMSEVRRTGELLKDVTGMEAKLFRPPWGKLTASKLCRLWLAGQTVVLWTSDPKDCGCRSARQVREWFAAHPLRGGDILLMHDDQPFAADVLPEVIEDARARGLKFATPLEWI